jgi:hypothetical protein
VFVLVLVLVFVLVLVLVLVLVFVPPSSRRSGYRGFLSTGKGIQT